MLTEEQKEFVERNHNLIYHFIKKHNLNLENWYDILAITICEAAELYDSDKAKESTFIMMRLYQSYCREIRRMNTYKRLANQNNLDLKEDHLDNSITTDNHLDIEMVINTLAEEDSQILKLKINGYSVDDICNIMKLPKSQVLKSIRTSQQIIKNYLGRD